MEIRRYSLSADLDWLAPKSDGTGLHAAGLTEAVREVNGNLSVERRYFLCSLTDFERFAETVRAHGRIENSPHGVLDVQFGEEANRSRTNTWAKNVALIRPAAINLLPQGTDRQSLRQRKLRADLSDSCRERLLFGGAT